MSDVRVEAARLLRRLLAAVESGDLEASEPMADALAGAAISAEVLH